MTRTQSESHDGVESKTRLSETFVRWGGLAAIGGPLLVLAANMYGVWETRTYGSQLDGIIEAGTTAPHLLFGGIRLLGGMLLVFGLIAIYAYQVEAAGKLGIVGFVVSMVGTVLLTGQAWFIAFFEPALVAETPEFLETVMAGEAGTMGELLLVGTIIPIAAQAVGWTIFGIATYRAGVFPRSAAIVLTIGALLLFVPVQGIPVVFQLAIAWLGFLVFTKRVEPENRETSTEARSVSKPS